MTALQTPTTLRVGDRCHMADTPELTSTQGIITCAINGKYKVQWDDGTRSTRWDLYDDDKLDYGIHVDSQIEFSRFRPIRVPESVWEETGASPEEPYSTIIVGGLLVPAVMGQPIDFDIEGPKSPICLWTESDFSCTALDLRRINAYHCIAIDNEGGEWTIKHIFTFNKTRIEGRSTTISNQLTVARLSFNGWEEAYNHFTAYARQAEASFGSSGAAAQQ